MLQITALMDNQRFGNRSLMAEHGLSMYVQFRGRRILFDCGSGANILYNAHKLGIDLKNLDAVVLSHSHYDHAAGYRDLVENGLGSDKVFTGPGFFQKKYARSGIRYSDLSAGFDLAFLEQYGISHCQVEGYLELCPGLYLVGNFPRVHNFETIPTRFVRRRGESFIADDFGDEICLVAEIHGGLAVLVGCAHPGILNMLSHIQSIFNQPVKAVFGGTHLVEADENRVNTTVDALIKAGVQILGLSHCTGEAAERLIQTRTDIQSCHLGSGDCVFLP